MMVFVTYEDHALIDTRELARRLNPRNTGATPRYRNFIYQSIRDKRNPMPHYRDRDGRRLMFNWPEVKAWY